MRQAGISHRQIASAPGRAASTVSRELRRNTSSGGYDYAAAQGLARSAVRIINARAKLTH